MAAKKTRTAKSEPEAKTTRTSVSFPADLYGTLEALAKNKKVTVAWVIRDAAEKYVSEKWPLFERGNA